MKLLSTVCCLFWVLVAAAQTIPAERLVDWSQAGFVGPRPEPSHVIDFVQAGGIADGSTANDAIFTTVINSITDSAVIYFPAGSYYFKKPLALKSNIILRGAGSDSTELVFDLLQERHLIQAIGRKENIVTPIVADALKGTTIITVQDASAFQVGNYILLGDNDSAVITSTWAYGTTGQIVAITAINGNELTLNAALRRDYLLALNPKIRKITLIENVGVERLKVNRLDATAQQTSNIHFWYAANCWVKCVESYKCNFAHVELGHSSHVSVTGSYFHAAHAYGGGGQGYGVMLHYNTGDCLVQENIFDSLRHSMILQAGANGNVLAYNYSDHPHWTGTYLPANSAGDLVLHGNYPYANLFEGNTVQHIVIDNSHGKNGPYNTIFRNRANLYGFFMNTAPASDNQNIVGNEITNDAPLMGNYVVSGTGHFEYGNNKRGTILPTSTTTLPETSLYLDSLPSYYSAKHICPPIGLPSVAGVNITETQLRYQEGLFTQCVATVWLPEPEDTTQPHEPIDTSIVEEPIDTNSIEEPIDSTGLTGLEVIENDYASVYPNPASGYFIVKSAARVGITQVQLYDVSGKLALSATAVNGQETNISISTLQSGLYIYQLHHNGQVQRGKLMVQ